MQPNLLMIEDDVELADILCTFLKRYNINVTNYDDPYLGISALSLSKYDLLILDLSLPGLDGLEICKEVRAKSNIPIIISSARSDLEDKIYGWGEEVESNAVDYLIHALRKKIGKEHIQNIRGVGWLVPKGEY